MKIPLSNRLLACCGFIKPGERVADVGCDHGYLGIYLLTKGIARSVIASDINQSPLASAVRNSEKYGVRNQISFHLSDGVTNIPRDFDILVCAGMGGDTMVSILSDAPWLKQDRYRLILQCQSKTPILRHYLSQNGWQIAQEIVLKDGKFLYTVMEVIWKPSEALSPGECYFPSALLENEHLSAYYKWVITGLETIVNNQKEHANPFAVQALNELRKREQT